MSNTERIAMITSRRTNIPSGWTPCAVQKDVKIRPQLLQDYCASLLTDVEHDLVVLIAGVVFADRTVLRRRGSGWPRRLALSVPVNALDVWRCRSVNDALTEALGYVTGDHWSFEFVEGGECTTIGQRGIPFDDGPYVVMPFSDGMDSFLQWQLVRREEPDVTPLRVLTSNRAISASRLRDIDAVVSGNRDPLLGVPIVVRCGNHPSEPTYRTRTFLFFCLAALAAAKTATTRIVVGENGVGAIGPSLLPYGDECPHRTTHPAFTGRVATFINRLLDTSIRFEHPQVLLTKGQVMARAIRHGVRGWELTNSCVRGPTGWFRK